jgi:hypothetical protein
MQRALFYRARAAAALHFFALAHKEEARAEKLNFQPLARARNFSAALKAASYLVRVKFLLYEITYKQVIISDFSLAGCGVAAD